MTRYYLIDFSDYTDTVGKATCKTEMRKSANQYIRAWNLDISITNISEISADEYNTIVSRR